MQTPASEVANTVQSQTKSPKGNTETNIRGKQTFKTNKHKKENAFKGKNLGRVTKSSDEKNRAAGTNVQ